MRPIPIPAPDRLSNSEGQFRLAGDFYSNYGKRIVDILAAVAGLIFLSPLLVFVACCIKVTSSGPALYRQVRIGRGGRPFQILKFRSMAARFSDTDLLITAAGDSRVTAVGKFLRRHKIDELPQLWNVLRGDMSLVGPRPEVPIYVGAYSAEQRLVLSVRPGITDPASLAYRHEEEILAAQADPEQFYRTEILPDKLARNITYLDEITFRNDVRIIMKTVSSCF
jgi:lipopolysaccharide/colanic/teichoic acid biosynthesis glycosyltransferase